MVRVCRDAEAALISRLSQRCQVEQLRQSSTGAWPHSRRNVAAKLLDVLKCHTRVHRLPSTAESIQVNYRSKNVCVT